jgi:metal-responsive CopG/Arc/MetJ family transcriptional regulator
MKTAISIPNHVFRQAESFAKQNRLSRSALYTEAVKLFLDQRRSADLTVRLNEVYAQETSELDPVLQAMQNRSISRESW